MAIKSLLTGSTMVIRMKVGVDDNGKDKIRKQKFGYLDLNAKDEDIYEVANALKKFSEYAIVDTSKDQTFNVISE